MRSFMSVQLLLAAALVVLLPYSLSHAQDAGEDITKTGTITEDLYLAGGRVSVRADVKGDVIAAGGRISIDQQIAGDVIAAGGWVDIGATILDDVRAAGGKVSISGHIGDDAIIAGGNVSLTPSATVGGRAWLAGGEIDIAGQIAKDLKAAGGTIIISGEIQGDVELISEKIEILPTARIKGNLSYSSARDASIDPAAQIFGQITRRPLEPAQRLTPVHKAGPSIAFLVGLMITGIVLFLALPNFSVSAARTIESDAWKSLGLGLAVLVTTPVVTILLMITIIGIPLGLVLLALYLVFLLAGYLTGALYLGDIAMRWSSGKLELSTFWRILSIVGALIALAIIALIPIIGGVLAFLVLLFGLGALELRTYRVYVTAEPKRSRPKSARRAKRR